MSPQGEVEKLHLFHRSRDRRKTYIPSGVYLFSPETLKCLDGRGYFDLKEQFIPRLRESGLPVRIFELNGEGIVRSVRSLKDYYEVNWGVVREDRMSGLNGGRRPGGNRVWVGKGAVISDSARLIGPVVIGEGAAVGAGCQIIGPAVVGSGVRIEEGVLFRESVALPGAVVPKGSQVEYAFWTSGGEVPCSGGQGGRPGGGSDPALDGEESLPSAAGEKGSYVFFKRAADVSLAAMGLILLAPLFLLIVLAIRLDSSGPVFYTQRRCGLGGREFPMVKFRTMIRDADRLQQELFDRKDVDGPVFKIKHDPRITRLGQFLRRTSLDELPQLWNVLRGDMSLVGPRPLVMEEMRFNPKWRDIRLTVKPGITGLWQISARGETSFHEWVQHDIAYVLKRSFFLDLEILFETIHKTFRRIGAH
ncbi:MAG: sugar transferase [Nitrospirae bacterium]|nr:sugar transferase [Nitrospirota bacterium]